MRMLWWAGEHGLWLLMTYRIAQAPTSMATLLEQGMLLNFHVVPQWHVKDKVSLFIFLWFKQVSYFYVRWA